MMVNGTFPVSVAVLDSSMVRPQYTPHQRSFLVREYYRTYNVEAVLLRFRVEFPDSPSAERFVWPTQGEQTKPLSCYSLTIKDYKLV